jgi:hypothetical protein
MGWRAVLTQLPTRPHSTLVGEAWPYSAAALTDYPPEHRRLAERMIARELCSAIIHLAPPDAANFPPRNRLISGLSLAVVW